MTYLGEAWYIAYTMTPQKLLSDISAGRFKPAYYFFGAEDFRITEAEKFVARQFLPESQLVTNHRRFDGKKTKTADLIAELSAYPMLGERQVFAISSFQSFKPTEITAILKLLTPPDPNRVIIFSSPADKTPKKTAAFFRNLTKVAEPIEFKKLTPGEAGGMVTGRLKKAGLSINRDALIRFVELIGGNRGALEAEIQKIIGFKGEVTGEQAVVTIDDISSVAAGFQVYSIFELAERVVTGDSRGTLAHITQLIADGNSPTGLLYHIGNHFTSLYKVKNGKPLEPYRQFLAPKFRQQSARYDNQQLEQIILEIASTDADLRRSATRPRLVLEALVLKLVSSVGR